MNTNKSKYIALLVVLLVALIVISTVIIVFSTTAGGNASNNFTFEVVDNKAVITSYKGKDTVIKIPSTIKGKKVGAIGEDAFKDSAVTSVEFDDSKTTINLEQGAFRNAKSLVYVKLPNKMDSIGKEAFYGCVALSHIIMPDTIKIIEDSAFYDCKSLTYNDNVDVKKFVLPKSLETIGDNAFNNCQQMSEVVVPNTVKSVGNRAFQNCTQLERFTIAQDNVIKTIGDYAFENTRLTSSVEDPLTFNKLEKIGEYAFSNIKVKFKYFRLSASVTNIGNYAFSKSAVSKFVFADAFSIDNNNFGEGVFSDTSELTHIGIDSDYAEGSKITSNRLPDSIKKIPNLTFSGAYKLLYNVSFTIGKDVTAIGDGAFALFNRTSSSSSFDYSNYVINDFTVSEDNDKFKVVDLGVWYSSQNDSSKKKKHSVLMNIEKESEHVLLAYIGAYNENGRWDINSENPQEFNYLSDNQDISDNISTIGAYAFAGVNMKAIYIPIKTEKLGAYVFAGSKITTVRFYKEDCAFVENTFENIMSVSDTDPEKEDRFTIIIMHKDDMQMRNGTIYKQLKVDKVNDKIDVVTGS